VASLLWFVVFVIVVLWFFGVFVAHLGNILYLLLVIALAIVVYNLLTGRRTL
jgi:hypothetical protein